MKEPGHVCGECYKAKQARKAFKHGLPMRSKEKLELIHSDVCGPFEISFNVGNYYFLTFIENSLDICGFTLLKERVRYSDSSRSSNCMSRSKVDAS